jgi:hypothetical protein
MTNFLCRLAIFVNFVAFCSIRLCKPLLRIPHRYRYRRVRSYVRRRSQTVAYRRDVRCHICFLRFHERAVELARTPQHSEKHRQTGPLADRESQEQFYHQSGDVVRSIIWDDQSLNLPI